MPNRYVREDAICSERVNALSWQAEIFYRRLINRVDDFGRYTAHPELLRATIFPMQLNKVSAADVVKLLLECERAGLLGTWKGQLDGKPYLVMNRWEQGRATKSKYPDPPTDVNNCLHAFTDVPDSDPDPDSDNINNNNNLETRKPEIRKRPEIGEAIAYGQSKHPVYPEAMVREWFAHRDSQHWEKTSGMPVSNWRSDLDGWCMKNLREAMGRVPGHNGNGNGKALSAFEIEKRIKAIDDALGKNYWRRDKPEVKAERARLSERRRELMKEMTR